MDTKQLNLKISENLFQVAESYAKQYGYKSVQELISECIREKLFEKNEFDETFSEKEISLIDSLITKSLKEKDFVSEKELKKILLE